MKFTKMNGIGNDYIYINGFEEKVDDPSALAIKLSDRHFSVGSDGVIIILPSKVADFRMRMFNADGSEGKMCGNGTRCVAKYVYEKGLTDKTRVTLETLAGIKTLDMDVEDGVVKSVSVQMGKADFKASDVPVIFGGDEMVSQKLSLECGEWVITCVSMGNPHCVTFVNDTKSLDLEKIGPQFEHNPIFPERVNTEFIKVIDDATLEMRVWERGSGETLACGTGACASVAAAVKNGICEMNKEITVKLLGGDLKITCGSDYSITMRGPAEFSYEGEVNI
ncbi:MAG TPA: diaminopimelate epimerase [Candidatus Faeciplasma gallinarum]|uniref:Diaminopimelate epimerase n=1 Tax=Candidatus Faeciplasma gallinarum TaxID=2840799 RepID=A0A9D1ENV0_9FIRM|nr:diaminopimelate epimerase [Candidatus Faeciplasma gallinarum]